MVDNVVYKKQIRVQYFLNIEHKYKRMFGTRVSYFLTSNLNMELKMGVFIWGFKDASTPPKRNEGGLETFGQSSVQWKKIRQTLGGADIDSSLRSMSETV